VTGVLTMNATIGCGHDPGKATPSSTKKLKVDSNPVLVKASVNGKSVSACPKTNTNAGESPCLTLTVTGTEATKLKAGGEAVLIGLAGSTDGTASPLGKPTVTGGTQTKLTAN
jgi:hypothetical protein